MQPEYPLKDKRVLLAWEFGGHLGHIMNMLPLARLLHHRGAEISFALKDLSRAEFIIQSYPQFKLFQAPIWQVPAQIKAWPGSLPQVLQRHGYKSLAAVEGMVRAWLSIYDAVKPDLVIYDYAFTPQIAFRGLPCKQISVGSGFFSPRLDGPAEAFTKSEQALGNDEAQVVAVINQVLRKFDRAPINFLGELNHLDANFLATFPELDHFGKRAGFDYVGPISDTDNFQKLKWQKSDGRPRLIGYLKPGKVTENILEAVTASGLEAWIFLPGMSKEYIQRYASDRLHLTTRPFNLASAAQQVELAICHGGHGTVATLLMHGCPLLMIPQQMEQYLLCKRVEKMGGGALLSAEAQVDEIRNVLNRMTLSKGLKAAAKRFSEKYERSHTISPVSIIVDKAELMLFDKAQEIRSPVVPFLQIEPTTRCNFTCGFCAGRSMTQVDIDFKQVKRLIYSIRGLKHVELQGEGEPLLHPDFFTMIDVIKKKHPASKVSFITNGSLFTKKNIHAILSRDITKISVSIESADHHEFQRIRGGKLEKVSRGIKELMRAKAGAQRGPAIGLAVTVLKSTLDQLGKINQLYEDLGLDGGIMVQPLQSMPDYTKFYSAEMLHEVPSRVELQQYGKIIASDRKVRNNFQASHDQAGFYSELMGSVATRRNTCAWLENGLYVAANGSTTSCCFIKDSASHQLGNLSTTSVNEAVWQRNKISRELTGGNMPAQCNRCPVAVSAIRNN